MGPQHSDSDGVGLHTETLSNVSDAESSMFHVLSRSNVNIVNGKNTSLKQNQDANWSDESTNEPRFIGPFGKKLKILRRGLKCVETRSENALITEAGSLSTPYLVTQPSTSSTKEVPEFLKNSVKTSKREDLNKSPCETGLDRNYVEREYVRKCGRPRGRPTTTTAASFRSTTPDTTRSPKLLGSKNDKKFLCPDCPKEFSRLHNFRYHRSIHEGTAVFAGTCPICNKTFSDKSYLSNHLKIHANAREYKCEYCDKRFNQRSAYRTHVSIHTGHKPHVCHVCSKAFSRKALLHQHLRIHTGERPFVCIVCDKSFSDRSNMLQHERGHNRDRPYKCSQCDKAFLQKSHLQVHLNGHSGLRPHKCPKCESSFSQSSNMRTHWKKCTGRHQQNLHSISVSTFPLSNRNISEAHSQLTQNRGKIIMWAMCASDTSSTPKFNPQLLPLAKVQSKVVKVK